MSTLEVDITSSPTEIRLSRVFNAPKDLVVQAMTTPELVKKWLGGKRAVVTEVRHDLRTGGSYKHAFRTHDGFEFFFDGDYLEVSDDKIVHTERFNGDPNMQSKITVTLTEHAGKTTMKMVMAFPNQEARDMVVKTGMADGAGESYDELDKLLAA
jgi:uncharacterized protein YndB with AHSA1/START domain